MGSATIAGGGGVPAAGPGRARGLLADRNFCALLLAQFLGAFNDHLFKIVVSLMAVDAGLAVGGAGAYLSLAGALFILPYLLFSGYAGYLADRWDKRSVLVWAKAFEVGVMGLACGALLLGRIDLLLAVLFLMATQSVFFSPAKYGLLPEMLPRAALVPANGLSELTHYLAVILGSAAGGALLTLGARRPEVIGLALVAAALAGLAVSLRLRTAARSGAGHGFRFNPWGEILVGIARLRRDRVLGPVVAGITFFEFLATLAMLDVLLVAKEIMALDDLRTGLLAVFVGLGLGLGSLSAGRLSRTGAASRLAPLGALGAGLALALLSTATGTYAVFAGLLVVFGLSGGLFLVPLVARLQELAGPREKGRLIATNNFVNMAGVLLATVGLSLLRDVLGIGADGILLFSGFVALLVAFGLLRPWHGRLRRPAARVDVLPAG